MILDRDLMSIRYKHQIVRTHNDLRKREAEKRQMVHFQTKFKLTLSLCNQGK